MPFKDPEVARAYARRYQRRRRARLREERELERMASAARLVEPVEVVEADVLPVRDPAGTIAQWAESNLLVPDGRLQGAPFVLEPWQVGFLRGAFKDGILEAGLSVARKNGKSGLIAACLLCHLAGPLNRPRWRGLVTSLTGKLATELREQVEALAATNKDISAVVEVRRSPAPGWIQGANGSRVDILAADRAGGHAVGGDLAIIDEGGLFEERDRGLWNSMLSSVSGRDGRLIVISIRADGPMFGELASRASEPGVFWREYRPATDSPLLDDAGAWKAANPGLGSIKSLDYMRAAARRAMASPADERHYLSHDLNLPLAPAADLLLTPAQWREVEVEALPDRSGPVALGIDLGGSSSLCAAVAIWPATGRVEAWAACPGIPSLTERSKADGRPGLYEVAAARRELRTYGSTRTTPVAAFLADVSLQLRGFEVTVGLDRYRMSEAEDAFEEAGVRWPVRWYGVGASAKADGSRCVRACQRLVLDRRLQCLPNRLLREHLASAELRYDSSGNPALARGGGGRIDLASALVLAAGLAEAWLAAQRKRRGLRWAVAR